MATSTVPRGRIEVAARRGETLRPGWAIDREGRPATTPEAALDGALQPLGGSEETGGYKGYGLSLVVDLLTGILGGARFGPEIVPLFSTHAGEANLGQAFLVIDPTAIDDAGAFEARFEHAIDLLVDAPTIPDAPGRVLMPGEPEAAAERRADERGIVIDAEHHASLAGLADRFAIPLPSARALRSDTRGGGAAGERG
jgi:LDH2 family malate/lactate/ureidoglycolate dehydrogenase